MPRYEDIRLLPYKAEQLYALVADIEHYPEFIPWCLAARIIERKEATITADLVVGYKLIRERFRSNVILNPARNIKLAYADGPFQYLKNEWEFVPAKNGCRVKFFVDFDFRNPILAKMMEMLFGKAVHKMIDAFEKRAATLYASQ